VYPTFLRTVPAHDHQALVMIELLDQLMYSPVILLHTNTDDSAAFADYFQELALLKKITVGIRRDHVDADTNSCRCNT
jgi:ABC-type branched-subunit amino acid transport system substrate-binding protein